MLQIGLSFFIFFFSVALHIGFCRRAARLQKKGLLLRPFAVIAGVNLLLLWSLFIFVKTFPPPMPLTSTVMYGLMSVLYLMFYANTQLTSPSQKIILLLKEEGPQTYQNILKNFSDREFIVSRLEELKQIGYLNSQKMVFQLNPQGEKVARMLNWYQKIVGRPWGG